MWTPKRKPLDVRAVFTVPFFLFFFPICMRDRRPPICCSNYITQCCSSASHFSLRFLPWVLPLFLPKATINAISIDGSYDPAGGPCHGNVGASMCCYSGEICSIGSTLCVASPNGPVGQYDNGSSIWRRSCTDVTWQDPACFAIAYREISLSSNTCILEDVERLVADSAICA